MWLILRTAFKCKPQLLLPDTCSHVHLHASVQDFSPLSRKIISLISDLTNRINLRPSRQADMSAEVWQLANKVGWNSNVSEDRRYPQPLFKNYRPMKHSHYWPLARSMTRTAMQFEEPLCLVNDCSKTHVTLLKLSLLSKCFIYQLMHNRVALKEY